MPYSNAGRAVMLDALGGVATFVSLHTSDPGTTGAAEVSGGSPAYARKGVSYSAAVGGLKESSTSTVHNVPGATTISHFGLWSALTGGTFYGGGTLSATETFATAGTYTIAAADLDLALT